MGLDVVATIIWGGGTIAGFSYAFMKHRAQWVRFRDKRAWRELVFTLALLITALFSAITLFITTFREELDPPPGTTMLTVGIVRGCLLVLAILAYLGSRE